MSKDTLHRYLFDNADVRGEIVQLESSYQEILAAHQYPVAIQILLGQLMAATSLLTATLKFSGDISVQVQGNGPFLLRLLMAITCNNYVASHVGKVRWLMMQA